MKKFTMKGMRDAQTLRQIWVAAYSAAFVAEFRDTHQRESFGFALEHTSAELAEAVADEAVEEWLRWDKEGR